MDVQITAGHRNDRGFSLIEILVVIVIVAILAAISIPVFLRQRDRGMEAQANSALKNAATAMDTYATDHQGSYPDPSIHSEANPEVLRTEGFSPTVDVSVFIEEVSGSLYCLEADHAILARSFHFSKEEGKPLEGPCP